MRAGVAVQFQRFTTRFEGPSRKARKVTGFVDGTLVLMIYAAEARCARMSAKEHDEVMREYGAYRNDLFAGAKAGDWAVLELSSTATCVQVRDGKRVIKDGPYAETREQLGGYYSLEGSEGEAIAWASKIPDAKEGTIEVRPLRAYHALESASGAPKVDPESLKQYLLLIYDDEDRWAAMSEADCAAIYARYREFSAGLKSSGKFIAGDELESVKTAKSVRGDGNKRIVRDGPFAETREQLGGYYRVLARDLDEAIALAARVPSAEMGTIEVRPVMDTSAYG